MKTESDMVPCETCICLPACIGKFKTVYLLESLDCPILDILLYNNENAEILITKLIDVLLPNKGK